MLVVMGFLGFAALCGIVYVFLSKNSSRMHKMTALAALILSGLVLGVCGIIIFVSTGIEEKEDPFSLSPITEPAPAPETNINFFELVLFLIVLLIAFGFIIYLGVKDRKKKRMKETVTETADTDFSSLDDF